MTTPGRKINVAVVGVGGTAARWIPRYKEMPEVGEVLIQDINAELNYFPQDVLRYVALRTGYPLTHVYRIATFYGAFSVKPRGQHTVNVCLGTACYVHGSERLMEKFSDILKIKPDDTTSDMQVTLKAVRCIGCCGLAPAVMVGKSVYGKLTPKDVAGIVAKLRQPTREVAQAAA